MDLLDKLFKRNPIQQETKPEEHKEPVSCIENENKSISLIDVDANIKTILEQLNALYLLTSKDDKQIKQILYELALARKVMPTEMKQEIVSIIEKLKAENKDNKAIVNEIVNKGLCSKATAYRLISLIENENK